jgi:hypothetical protein
MRVVQHGLLLQVLRRKNEKDKKVKKTGFALTAITALLT